MPHPVIVGVDDPQISSVTVDWAADEAHLRSLPLRLIRAPSWDTHHRPDDAAEQLILRSDERMLQDLAARAAGRHRGLEVSCALAPEPAREALVALGEQAALLVLGSRGRGGFPELLTGSTSLHVAAQADCPVVVVPGSPGRPGADGGSPGGVAVGVHGRRPCEGLLAFAFEAAQRYGVPLRVVHAWSYPPAVGPGHAFPPVYEAGHVASEASRLMSEILAGWRQKFPDVQVTEDIVRSGAAKHLVEVSSTQQLMVVGRHGHPGNPVRRLGSVSQAVVHHTHCPIAVLPEN